MAGTASRRNHATAEGAAGEPDVVDRRYSNTLEDERVYKLHWRGSKKKARNCWTHVCAELARHDFVPLDTREAFRQKTVDEYLVAAGYFVGPAASNSTGNDETKQGEAGAASAASAAAPQTAEDTVAEACWSVFAADVMEHLVWPAAQKGHINAAPKAHVDNPKLWTDGILPILDDQRVYTLHWKGSKKKAKSSWTHVCAELARHDFVPLDTKEAFRQKTVDDFLVAAGYFCGTSRE